VVVPPKRRDPFGAKGVTADVTFVFLEMTSPSNERRAGTMTNGEVERTTGQPPGSREREAAFATATSDVATIVNNARSSVARSVSAALTSAYWLVGLRIVEFEQSRQERAEYGEEMIAQLADELMSRFGRGFSRQNLRYMRQFFLTFSPTRASQTASGALLPGAAPQIRQTASGESDSPPLTDRFAEVVDAFPLAEGGTRRLTLN